MQIIIDSVKAMSACLHGFGRNNACTPHAQKTSLVFFPGWR